MQNLSWASWDDRWVLNMRSWDGGSARPDHEYIVDLTEDEYTTINDISRTKWHDGYKKSSLLCVYEVHGRGYQAIVLSANKTLKRPSCIVVDPSVEVNTQHDKSSFLFGRHLKKSDYFIVINEQSDDGWPDNPAEAIAFW